MGWKTYRSEKELVGAIADYFKTCDEAGELYDEAGMCLALNVDQRQMRDWLNQEGPFQYIVRRAYLHIQQQIATHPVYREKSMVTKSIFLLKQPQFGGYQDKTEEKKDISFKVTMGDGVDAEDFK